MNKNFGNSYNGGAPITVKTFTGHWNQKILTESEETDGTFCNIEFTAEKNRHGGKNPHMPVET